MSEEQEITMSFDSGKKESLKARTTEIKEFKLQANNIETFYKTVREDRRSVEAQIQVMTEDFVKFEKTIIDKIKIPSIKNEDWSRNFWYHRFGELQQVKDTNFNISALKSWIIDYYDIAFEQMFNYAKLLNQQFLDIEKLKAQKDMLKEMIEIVKKEKDDWSKNYFSLLEDRFAKINESIIKITNDMVKSSTQIQLYNQQIQELKKEVKENANKGG